MPFFGVPIRNGLPIGLGSVAGFGVQQFDPSQLFEGGTVPGAWYDPSDLSTMFDTSAGTTPVAMPGQGSAVSVGLMLDKSQGLVLGPELVTNGDFSSPSLVGWSSLSGGTGAVSNDQFLVTASGGAYTGQVYDLSSLTSAGKWYVIKASLISGTARITVRDGGVNDPATPNIDYTGPQNFTFYVYRDSVLSADLVLRTATSGATSIWDNISVRELPGNHAISFNNTTARPELRARVNLLTYSEEFDNAAWQASAGGVSVVVDIIVAPNGTLTGDKLVERSGAGNSRVVPAAGRAAGTYSQTIYAKAAERSEIVLCNTVDAAVAFNLSNGTIRSTVGSPITSITSVGNGWYRCSMTYTSASITYTAYAVGDGSTAITVNGCNYTGDGTSGIFIWGADLRPANIGANVPAYQRIADANTYDTSGFPLYLRFDGIDDSMYTPANLNLSGTDKATVFAGVRKLSDATLALLVELSANWISNAGTFVSGAPDATGGSGDYTAGARGTAAVSVSLLARSAITLAPVTNVFTATHDIPGDLSAIRLNGAASGTNGTGDKGSGNFGSYPLFIGARNNSSLWFNGHLHSLIIAGSAVSAGNISATEQWVAGRTGISIP